MRISIAALMVFLLSHSVQAFSLKSSANISLTSDYMFRGVSQTEETPAIQGGMNWSHDVGAYVGFWGSNVLFASGDPIAHLELDLFGGYQHAFDEDHKLDIMALNYTYIKAHYLNTFELIGKYNFFDHYEIGVSYAPNWLGLKDYAARFFVNYSRTFFWDLVIHLAAGYNLFGKKTNFMNYWDYNAGLSREFFGTLWDVSYIGSSVHQFNELDEGRFVFSVSKSF